jgi:O-antigen ligase
VLWLLTALLIGLGSVSLPDRGVWLGVKAFALETVGVLLAVWVVSQGEWTRERVRCALLAPPNLAILGFLAWVGLSAALSDLPRFSRFEAMRHLGGGLVYFAVLYGLPVRRSLNQFVTALALAGSLSAIIAFASIAGNDPSTPRISGAFQNEQLLASVLCLLLPVVLMASQTGEEAWRRNTALLASVIMGFGILVAQNRSVWAATAVSLAVLGGLSLRSMRPPGSKGFQKHQIILPLAVALVSTALFLGISRSGTLLSLRAQTLSSLNQDKSVKWRLGMWNKCLRMVRDRPVFGWGVGAFPIRQARYFHPDVPGGSQEQVMQEGTSLSEDAHNTYLQIAAELGLPGLALYLAIPITFFVTALRAVPRRRPGLRKAVLLATVAAIAAQMVSSIGNPAWEYAECSLFFWLMLGLGMAAAGVGERGAASAAPARRNGDSPLVEREPSTNVEERLNERR